MFLIEEYDGGGDLGGEMPSFASGMGGAAREGGGGV